MKESRENNVYKMRGRENKVYKMRLRNRETKQVESFAYAVTIIENNGQIDNKINGRMG